MTRITVLTDFGTGDGYAAAMKGVLASLAPDALVDDASHDIPAGDVQEAMWALARYAFLYPAGTVHLVVVDPGVGTARRAVAAEARGRFFVAPDNGVLTRILLPSGTRAVSLENPEHRRAEVSATFHGRDVFAPAAAHLATGGVLESLGPPAADLVRLRLPEPLRVAGKVRGEVVHVDRYGTLLSNIPRAELPAEGARVRLDGRDVGPVRRTFGDVASGEVLALVGSEGLLEVAVRDGSAADRLGAERGARVEVVEER